MTEGTTLGTRETAIKIDGVEYDLCPHQAYGSPCNVGEHEICPGEHFQVGRNCYAPKRVQTGWICHGCSQDAPCVEIAIPVRDPPSGCLRYNMGDLVKDRSRWTPFYGKVVE